MGITIRGHCSTCGRMGKLVEPEYIYCSEKCSDPKEIRRVNIKNFLYFFVWATVIGSYTFYVCHQNNHGLIVSLIISVICGVMSSAMMFTM